MASSGGGVTAVGGGMAISGGGTPRHRLQDAVLAHSGPLVPAEFNH